MVEDRKSTPILSRPSDSVTTFLPDRSGFSNFSDARLFCLPRLKTWPSERAIGTSSSASFAGRTPPRGSRRPRRRRRRAPCRTPRATPCGGCDAKERFFRALCLACEIAAEIDPVLVGANDFPHLRSKVWYAAPELRRWWAIDADAPGMARGGPFAHRLLARVGLRAMACRNVCAEKISTCVSDRPPRWCILLASRRGASC